MCKLDCSAKLYRVGNVMVLLIVNFKFCKLLFSDMGAKRIVAIRVLIQIFDCPI